MESLSPQKLAQIKDLLKEMDFNPSSTSLIQDNKIIFPYQNQCYRCKMPSQKVQTDAEAEQNRFKIELLQRKGTMTRKKLIEVLKENQDIDIKELNKQKEKMQEELQDAYLDLANVNPDDKDEIEKRREKKNQLEDKFMELTIEITEYLSPSIEEQVKRRYYEYVCYACTEKCVPSDVSGEEKWVKVWNSFEDYNNDETGLTFRALDYTQSLLLNIRE